MWLKSSWFFSQLPALKENPVESLKNISFSIIQTHWFVPLVFAWKRSWSCGCFYIAFFLFSEIRRMGWWRHFIHFWTHCLSTQCQGKWNSWRDVVTVMIAASKTSPKGPFIQNTVSNQSCQSRWKTLGSDLLQKKGLCQVDIVGPCCVRTEGQFCA